MMRATYPNSEYYKRLRQCEVVNKVKDRGDCCSLATSKDCNQPGPPAFPWFGMATKTQPSPLTFDDIKKQICQRRPIMFQWTFLDGGAHDYVIIGYRVSPNHEELRVFDPMPINHGQIWPMTYDEFSRGRGAFNYWFGNWFDLSGGSIP